MLLPNLGMTDAPARSTHRAANSAALAQSVSVIRLSQAKNEVVKLTISSAMLAWGGARAVKKDALSTGALLRHSARLDPLRPSRERRVSFDSREYGRGIPATRIELAAADRKRPR